MGAHYVKIPYVGAPEVKVLDVWDPCGKIPYVGAHYVKISYVGAP